MLKLQSRGFLVKLFFSQGFLSCWLQRNRGHGVHSFTYLFDRLLCVRHWTRCRGYNRWARQHGSYHCGVYIPVGETHRPIPSQCDKEEWEGAESNSWSRRTKGGLLEDRFQSDSVSSGGLPATFRAVARPWAPLPVENLKHFIRNAVLVKM